MKWSRSEYGDNNNTTSEPTETHEYIYSADDTLLKPERGDLFDVFWSLGVQWFPGTVSSCSDIGDQGICDDDGDK